jgi:lipopolysaccharide transport system ATP-binding protein
MTEPTIKVRGLSKCYRLGSINRHTLVEEVEHWWHKVRGRDPRREMGKVGPGGATERRRLEAERDGAQEFWALKDISFDVHPGEVVGIIGRNGAGKSTLLKILTRITEPTEGEAIIEGRVGSLLEVGTGFHPELTGRENIFMNGTILGMKRAEIARKFDEIVAFSELEKFIDTPVKRYSSGMYVRLAFAVAAHLDAEILFVDEVLAVGDFQFQRKCLGKMEEVAKGGRTVLLVSHNLASIAAMCSKAILLNDGRIECMSDDVRDVLARYSTHVERLASTDLSQRLDRKGEGEIQCVSFQVCDESGQPVPCAIVGRKTILRVRCSVRTDKKITRVVAALCLSATSGQYLAMLNSEISGYSLPSTPSFDCIECEIPKMPFPPGSYFVNITVISNGVYQDWVQEAAVLRVEMGDYYGSGKLPPPSHAGMCVEQTWRTQG